MNWLRNSLIAAILVITYVLFIRWNEFSERQQVPTVANQPAAVTTPAYEAVPSDDAVASSATEESDVPEVSVSAEPVAAPKAVYQPKLVTVKTDVLEVQIDTNGGDVLQVVLLKHLADKADDNQPFVLMTQNSAHTYVARSGLAGGNGPDGAKKGRAKYSVAKTNYSLNSDDQVVVDLTLDQENAHITKRFTFTKSSYLIDVEYIITNRADTPWAAKLYGQIIRDGSEPSYGYMGMRPYLGAAITTPEVNYEKVSFDDMDDGPFKVEQKGGWVSLIQHYFISAWIPPKDATNSYELSKSSKGNYVLRFISETTTVAPHSVGTVKAGFYAGPKNIRRLEEISPHLDLTIDYSFLWFIAKPLFFALDFIHGLVGNWGVAIILLTVLIKAVFFYPSAMSYRSMAKMRKLQPMMAELKERYGEDKQKMSGELMKLYKKEKVNPFGGCLPILLQMPVFISLYWMIMESVELRHQPFFLWIQDLSVKDPLFILPLLMGVTMYIQQKLNPTPPDPMQAKVMQMMPIGFTFLFMFFPAGLVLYWVVNNTLSISQQYVITRNIEKAG